MKVDTQEEVEDENNGLHVTDVIGNGPDIDGITTATNSHADCSNRFHTHDGTTSNDSSTQRVRLVQAGSQIPLPIELPTPLFD